VVLMQHRRIAKMMYALQMALRGTPCLYQGDELGLTEAERI
jgi:alpha-glucosidase